MGLKRGLEVEELDPERLAVRQLEHAALALAPGLAQKLVRAAQEPPVLARAIGDGRHGRLAED